MESVDKLYWTKVLLASVIATLFSVLRSINLLGGFTILILGIALYFPLSDLLGRKFGIERSSALKIGIGAFFFTLLAAWVIIFTLLRTLA
ncbi:MAG: hypothetical protein ACETVR_03475 [Candidatus Bathyarchaeia archaeon]